MTKILRTLALAAGPLLLVAHAGTKTVKEKSAWGAVAKKYREAALVQMNMKKTVKSAMDVDGDKGKVFEGKLYLSQGLFRMETTTPEKVLVVFDGKSLWTEQAPSGDFDTKTQVTKVAASQMNDAQSLMIRIFEKGTLQKLFKIESEKQVIDDPGKKEVTIVRAVPISEEMKKNLKLLILGVDKKSSTVSEIGYIDDIGNQTIMKFSDIEIKSADKNLFDYKPPKGAQVNQL